MYQQNILFDLKLEIMQPQSVLFVQLQLASCLFPSHVLRLSVFTVSQEISQIAMQASYDQTNLVLA